MELSLITNNYDGKKLLYLAALKTLISSGSRFGKTAQQFGIGSVSRSQVSACKDVYAKVSDAKESVSLTPANVKELYRSMQVLGYLFTVDRSLCQLMFGLSYRQFCVYLSEVRAAIHGKRALQDFYLNAPDPDLM